MNQEQFKLLIGQVPQLTKEQLSELAMRIKLLSDVTKSYAGKQEFGNRVLQAIADVMKKQNVETSSAHSLRKSAAYVGAKDKLQDLSVFFDSISKSKLVQDQILREAIQLLYHDLLQWQIAVSSHTMLKQIHRIPSVLNKSFPGYAASGLLQKIVKGA